MAHFNCQRRQKARQECNCCCNFSLLLHIWIMNAGTLLQPAFCCLCIAKVSLQTHRPQVSAPPPPSPFSHTLCQLHIWHGHSAIPHRHTHTFTFTFTYAWLSLTEIMLPQMCELLMSFSQLATWAILPVCQFAVGSSPQLPVAGFSSFSCCNFHKFLKLCMCLSTCVWLCVCVCTLIIFTWQMLRLKCSSSNSNNSCTYALPAQPHRAASRTGKWIQLNPSAGPILRNETVYYATYRQIRIYTYVTI